MLIANTNHMPGDILSSTQILITHLVTSFSIGDNHDILGIYLACRPKQQNEHVYSLRLFWWSVCPDSATDGHSHAPPISHDYRDDHRQKMSRPSDWPRVGCSKCHQACDSRTNCLSLTSDHHSRARDYDLNLFQSKIVLTISMTFCRTDHSEKKSHNIVTDQAFVA